MSLLAIYYLINQERDSFVEWGNGFYYGSGNTESWNYYKSGVPKNVAYQPTNMMKFDIGIPDKVKVKGRDYLVYQYKTDEGDYTVIGNTSSTTVNHAELSLAGSNVEDDVLVGSLPIIPTYVYYVEGTVVKGFHSTVKTSPLEGVVARNYTKGITMFRTDMFGYSDEFLKTNITLLLPNDGEYRQVLYDGMLSEIVTETILFGYEGKIFSRKEHTASKTPSPSAPEETQHCDIADCKSKGDINAVCVFGHHCMCSTDEGFECASDPANKECQPEILCVPSFITPTPSIPSKPTSLPTVLVEDADTTSSCSETYVSILGVLMGITVASLLII